MDGRTQLTSMAFIKPVLCSSFNKFNTILIRLERQGAGRPGVETKWIGCDKDLCALRAGVVCTGESKPEMLEHFTQVSSGESPCPFIHNYVGRL